MKYVEAIEPYNINEAEHNKVQSLTKKHRIQNRPSSTQLNTATKVDEKLRAKTGSQKFATATKVFNNFNKNLT